jgi:hypothetical protein
MDILPDFYKVYRTMYTSAQELGSRVLDLMSIGLDIVCALLAYLNFNLLNKSLVFRQNILIDWLFVFRSIKNLSLIVGRHF